MFREGPGTREEFIKAEAEIALSENSGDIKVIEHKEGKEEKESSSLKFIFGKATEFAKRFVKSKEEKAENV